jgi:hypothetical protein
LENTGQSGSLAGVDGRIAEAWDLVKGNENTIIAINDTGIDLNHPDLKDNLLPPLNFPTDSQSLLGFGAFGDHGTSCAGVAAARGDNNQGVSGVCPGCAVLPVWVAPFGPDGSGLLIDDNDLAMNFVKMTDMGVGVISNSWGKSIGDPLFKTSIPQYPVLPMVVADAFDYAETKGRNGKGTVILFAAGNNNENIAKNPYPSHPNVITVAAVDNLGLKSFYSNYGNEIDIAAPSDGGTLGITTTQIVPTENGPPYTSDFGGTSSATPFVAGVIGLMLSANPELSAQEIRSILQASATKIDNVYGEWDANGFSPYYGHGLVNAYKAVKMALGECSNGQCEAPSDSCLSGNCAKEPCSPCRASTECAPNHVCQALPALGMSTCVPKAEQGQCSQGFELHGEYCVPTRQTCGLCGGTELCDGQDNDCNGVVDDSMACSGRRCFAGDQDCAQGERCAATFCVQACAKTSECPANFECKAVKERYGKSENLGGCRIQKESSCKYECGIVASTLADESLAKFVSCMEDGNATCSQAQSCISLLPITQ